MKVCSKCKNPQPTSNFYAAVETKDGLRSACKICNTVNNKRYYQDHKEESLERSSSWLKAHKVEMRPYNRDRMRARLQASPKARLSANMRGAVWRAMTDKGGRSWESLVGYSVGELKQHLEKQFSPEMSWGNYGKGGWVIDHIEPICSFDYSSADDKQFKQCWALGNLRPLWEKDNLKKVGEDMKKAVRKANTLALD